MYAVHDTQRTDATKHKADLAANMPQKGKSKTGIECQELKANSQKLIENGQLVIIKNGIRYNAQGQIVK